MSTLIALTPTNQLSSALVRRCDIVRIELGSLQQGEVMQFFARQPELFFQCLQRHYPINPALLEFDSERWDWKLLSVNRAMGWSQRGLERLAVQLGWARLSADAQLPWNEAVSYTHLTLPTIYSV